MADQEDYFERLVDRESLKEYLESELGEAGRFEITRHEEGHSNETLFVTWGDRELVLRRPPPGETAETAHDVLREYTVIDALQDTNVPVPPTVLACDDESVIGSDFYVMDRLDGHVLRNEEPERFATPEYRRRISEKLVDNLAGIHAVDYESVGLGDFGYPEGYTQRQVDRWSQQLMWAMSKTVDTREVSLLYEIGEWLNENVPGSHEHTLVHGDYKLDNVMFRLNSEPELIGIFDWEMSTLGDPLVDLGWMLSFWRDPDDPEPAVPELTSGFIESEGYLNRAELVERYEERTGLKLENDRFYRTLAVYKMAALGEMFLARYLEGNADDPLYPLMEEGVPKLAERAMRIIEGEVPL